MRYRSEFKHGFTNRRCVHCAILKAFHGSQEKRAHKSMDTQFFLQNVQNEIFKIFKNMFKNNMKFTRAACWINSKISNRHRNTTLIIFLFWRYCWSLLWCNYWKSLKSDSHLPKNSFICFNESPLKVMKNAFYFILKALLVLKIFKFLYWLFGHVKKPGLIRKIQLLSKVMTPQPGYKQLHILCNISLSKSNLTVKFGQVIEYNEIFFFKESCRKWGRETSSIPFGSSTWHIIKTNCMKL